MMRTTPEKRIAYARTQGWVIELVAPDPTYPAAYHFINPKGFEGWMSVTELVTHLPIPKMTISYTYAETQVVIVADVVEVSVDTHSVYLRTEYFQDMRLKPGAELINALMATGLYGLT